MDRALPSEVIRNTRMKRLIGIAAAVLAVVVLFVIFRALIGRSLNRNEIRTAIAEIGPIDATLSASGVVVPEAEQIITAPASTTLEQVFLRTGDSVHAGESILRLNTEILELSYNRQLDELELKKNNKRRLRHDLERRQTDLQVSYEIKKLQLQFVQSQFDRVKRLHDIGGANLEEFDRATLNLKIAQRELDQLACQIDNQKISVTDELAGLDLEIRIQENTIAEMRRTLDLAQARAGRDGVVTWVADNLGAQVNAGEIIARVADLSSFKIEAGISDVHADKLGVGGRVLVRIGEKFLDGHIASVSPAVQNSVMSFTVVLADKADRALRPSLRTDVYVVTSSVDNVVRVKNGPFFTGPVDQEVFVVRGNTAVRTTVNIGAANFDYVELQGDIIPGDEIIISDTKDFRHMKKIAINN